MKSPESFFGDARLATIILGLAITGLLGFVAFAPPLRRINAVATSALVSYWVLAGGAYWIERKRAGYCSRSEKQGNMLPPIATIRKDFSLCSK
jgi:peptidoglycan biosynthesis protein MviN/MurJ (putative lipid II flippase)